MIAPAIADALGLGERQGRSAADNILGWLADRETLLVLDNCEHLLDGVVVLLERLLAGSPRLAVLATSRARLLVPFEWVFPVPGLCVEADDGGPGDAVELFLDAGSSRREPADVPTTRNGSPPSAGASTAWRWRSSWPPPGSRRSGSTGSKLGWPTGCGC